MMKQTLFVGLALAAGAVQAQDYFDFDDLPGAAGGPAVQIDLNPAMLGFVRSAMAATGEPGASELLDGIEGIRVRVYEDLSDPEAVLEYIDDASGRLEREGWQRSVYVQDGGDRVHVYMRMNDTQLSGMTVMVSDGSEAVFINIAGIIDPATLGRVAGTLGINGVVDAFAGGVLGGAAPPAAVPAPPRAAD